MKLNAKARLFADKNPDIENKENQIKLLRKSLPSKQNRVTVSPVQKLNTRKQILNLEDKIVDDRLKDKNKEA